MKNIKKIKGQKIINWTIPAGVEVGEGDELHQGLEPACLQDIHHVLLVEDQLGDEEHESVPLLPVHAPVQHGEKHLYLFYQLTLMW